MQKQALWNNGQKSKKSNNMAYYNTDNHDEQIDRILRYLFDHQTTQYKRALFCEAQQQLHDLDIAAQYQLFALVREQLPRRAKLLFSAEDFSGKQQVILEVMQHLAYER